MKRTLLIALGFLCAFVAGAAMSWWLFREIPLQLKVVPHKDGALVYTFYERRAGEEIRHGWSVDYTATQDMKVEDREKFEHGRKVLSAHQVDAHPKLSDPAWAFTNRPNKAPEPTTTSVMPRATETKSK